MKKPTVYRTGGEWIEIMSKTKLTTKIQYFATTLTATDALCNK